MRLDAYEYPPATLSQSFGAPRLHVQVQDWPYLPEAGTLPPTVQLSSLEIREPEVIGPSGVEGVGALLIVGALAFLLLVPQIKIKDRSS